MEVSAQAQTVQLIEHLVLQAEKHRKIRDSDSVRYYMDAAKAQYAQLSDNRREQNEVKSILARLEILQAREAEVRLDTKTAFKHYSIALELAVEVSPAPQQILARASLGTGRNHPDQEAGLAFLEGALIHLLYLKDSLRIRSACLGHH